MLGRLDSGWAMGLIPPLKLKLSFLACGDGAGEPIMALAIDVEPPSDAEVALSAAPEAEPKPPENRPEEEEVEEGAAATGSGCVGMGACVGAESACAAWLVSASVTGDTGATAAAGGNGATGGGRSSSSSDESLSFCSTGMGSEANTMGSAGLLSCTSGRATLLSGVADALGMKEFVP